MYFNFAILFSLWSRSKKSALPVLPYINPFAFDGDANFGDSVQLTCHVARGDLPLHIDWLFNGIGIGKHLGVTTSKIGVRTSFLSVGAAQAANTGLYTCQAVNEAGRFDYSAALNVHGMNVWT